MALDPSMPVLVVDDYNTMVRIIRNLLRQLGFADVDDANDGATALAKMHSKRYGLVISDWNMEPMTGYDLLREVRADPELGKTPFIMVTAESKTENVIAARKAGVNNYIVKPFNAQTLKTKIESVFAYNGDCRRPRLARCRIVRQDAPYHASLRVTAFGATPAAANVAFKRDRSGASRPPESSAWRPETTNRQSTPNEAAPFRSVRTESPIASTRRRGVAAAAKQRGFVQRRRHRSAHAACRNRAPRRQAPHRRRPARRRSRRVRRRARRRCRDWRRP